MRSSLPALCACVAVGVLGAGSALAAEAKFTEKGCSEWEVPAGVTSVSIHAVGAAGGSDNGDPTPGEALGGNGDGYSGTLAVSGAEKLDVCVDVGGGTPGSFSGADPGGAGGGASGVSLGTSFETPVLVAAGGGGAGEDGCGSFGAGGGAGGGGIEGHESDACDSGGPGGGGAGSSSEGGTAGGGSGGAESGKAGNKFTSAGPGVGGAGGNAAGTTFASGGGGGGGYYGGGGGGAGGGGAGGAGGGGGSDYCAASATGCERHATAGSSTEAGEAEGDANVILTYVIKHPTETTLSCSPAAVAFQVTESCSVKTRDTSSAPSPLIAALSFDFYKEAGCKIGAGAVSLIAPGTELSFLAGVTVVGGKAGFFSANASYPGDAGHLNSSTPCIDWYVGNPPEAKIESPASGRTYVQGEVVATKFSCKEGKEGTGLESCGGVSASSGSGELNTSEPGEHEYTVLAKSKDGLTGTAKIKYTVVPACTSISGYGRVGTVASEGITITDQLSRVLTGKQILEAGIQKSALGLVKLTTLASAECLVVPGGHEFRGAGAATLKGVPGYAVTFSFTVVGKVATFGLTLSKGADLLLLTSQPMDSGWVETIK